MKVAQRFIRFRHGIDVFVWLLLLSLVGAGATQAKPAISIDDVAVTEGDAGTVDAVFTVTLSAASGEAVVVSYATRDGSATAASDYQPTSGTLSFAPGQTAQMLSVVVNGDTEVEPDETFIVDLTDPIGATIADGHGQSTILNDDPSPGRIRLVSAPATPEGARTATVTAERFGGNEGAARVTISASSGTALAGEDFVAASPILEWAAGESGTRLFELAILDDNLAEDDETVLIRLSDPAGASLGTPSELELVILDDDTARTCIAADGEQLTLEDDTVLDDQEYEICGTITVGPNFAVMGPNGVLTLRAGVAVVFRNGFSLLTDGTLVVEIDPGLVP